ncbi:MAG: DUF6159 family protein, partial [Dehalococcoidia bacterium]|nr:DUF6159 family protein [Dehalococcoidia bacterium]
MFATIGHTFELMRASWRVLMKDRELILFPIMSAVVVVLLAGAFMGLAASTGTLDRVQTASETGSAEGATMTDGVLGFAMLFVVTFIVLFFNTALIASAMLRLRGGDPNVGYGLRAASSHVAALLVWALISATVGMILQALRNRTDNFIGRIAIGMVGGVWAYMTFFVVPVIVAQDAGPIEAIKRSSSLFRETWGRQVASSFGFGLVYVGAALIAILPAALLFTISPALGVMLGALLL